jgi:hypothetical protein
MEFVGGLVQQIGVAIAITGFAIWIGTILYRFGIIFRVHQFQGIAFLIGFYARAAGMVGIVAVLAGGVIAGTTPWPWLIAVFVLGAPSLALLLVRPVRGEPFKIDLPKRGKS